MNTLRGLFVFNLIAFAMAGLAPCIQLNDGYNIPILALGTGRGTIKESETLDQVRQAVFWAIEEGYRHIDTAAIYGDEEQVGLGIAEAINKGIVTRDQLFVTTKLWNDKHARQDVVPALRESLRRLGLDYVDLYLIHFPISEKADGSPDNIDHLETWQGMQEARDLGLARSIGVSNFNITQISRLVESSGVRPAVNQFEVNPTMTQEPLVTHCQNLGIAVMAYSPFGFVVSRKGSQAPPPGVDDPTLVALANKYGKTVEQIVLRYLIERGLIPIPKSTNKGRIAQNIDVFDFQLSDNEVATISRFNKNIRVVNPTDWKDYPNYPFERD
ncbi:hypothetical protein O3G_MSEX006237 [Manduca sexta]|uniref:NADP-dependent oxidoreductase domain-containing protein n=1 Tax=Manduca sexta TaxID=7130 RepID=A0A921Z3U9_MANSE|nr:hypothetical protein O3G_MSEX006237 [Manduca sexta]